MTAAFLPNFRASWHLVPIANSDCPLVVVGSAEVNSFVSARTQKYSLFPIVFFTHTAKRLVWPSKKKLGLGLHRSLPTPGLRP